MHKRVTFFAILPLLFLILLVLFFRWITTDPTAPTFVRAGSQPNIGPIRLLTYDSLSENPFPGNKVWLSVFNLSPINAKHYLFHLQNRKVLGELRNAAPVFMDPDHSKVLCMRHEFEGAVTLRGRLLSFLDRITFRKFHLYSPGNDAQAFWVLDLKRNSAKLIACLPQPSGAGNWFLPQAPGLGAFFVPSPNFRYAYNKSAGSYRKPEFLICDLQKETLTRAAINGLPMTWWDNQSIVLRTDTNSFILYHVPTRNVTNLFGTANLTQFFAGLSDQQSPGLRTIVPVGTGKARSLYLARSRVPWLDGKSYLAKIQQPAATLHLVTNKFTPAGYPNTIDPTETWQLYTGDGHGYPGNGVYVREISTGRVRTLVDDLIGPGPLPGTTNFFSAMLTELQTHTPNFYNDTVIYISSNALWQIDLNGSNNTRLFPPP